MSALKASKKVFVNYIYIALTFSVSAIMYSFIVLLPNTAYARIVLSSQSIDIFQKIKMILNLLMGATAQYTTLSTAVLLSIVVLVGVNTAFFAYYFKTNKKSFYRKETGTGFIGALAGFLGAGCAACGIFAAGPLLAALGGSGLVALMPMGGIEIGLLGALLLLFSIYSISKAINTTACKTIPELN